MEASYREHLMWRPGQPARLLARGAPVGGRGPTGGGEPRGAQWFGRGVRAQAARLAERTASLVELDAAVNAGAATRVDTIQNPGGTAL